MVSASDVRCQLRPNAVGGMPMFGADDNQTS
jgi:hypothetical protein